ncbi:MAG: RES family NAD+ phosphorylase [Desulfobulbaceae bacterium]|nr:RES family NAD+ phosphorylase [Desulfobulbaceae bacterium]
MGIEDLYYESLERGWDAPDKYVCSDCVEDDFLKDIINTNLGSRKCSYCKKGSRGFIAAPVEAILPAISSGLHYYFNDRESADVPWEGGGFAIDRPETDTGNALYEIGLGCQNDLFDDISNAFQNDIWIHTAGGSWVGSHLSELLKSMWDRFVHTVKHENRYFFPFLQSDRTFDEHLSPAELLEKIGNMSSQLRLISVLPSDTVLFRVRQRDANATWALDWELLGPPPNYKATAGRMNPAGISYFYLATDQRTAIAETINKPPCKLVSASFKTRQELLLLDLCELPKIPSVFDESKHDQREWTYFLSEFVKEISKPINKNGQEHIDYVASQIVSEYFAKQFRTEDRRIINGVKYPSAICPGGVNIVLFPPPKGFNKFAELVSMETAFEKNIHNWSELFELII